MMYDNNFFEMENETFSEYYINNNLINNLDSLRSPEPYNDFNSNEFSNNSINDERRYFINFDKSEQNTINEADAEVEKKQKKEEKISGISNSKSTAENSFLNKINQVTQKKRKYKHPEKMGCRKRKNPSINMDINEIGKNIHDKKRPDNIRTKYKRAFFKSLIEFLNEKIDKCPKISERGKLIKLNGNIIKKDKKNVIQQMLKSTGKEFLSLNISTKFKKFKPENNKELIDFIYKIGEKSITKILDKTIKELMDIFREKNTKDKDLEDFKNFKRLSFYIKDKSKGDSNYEKLFLEESLNYEVNIEELHGRNELNFE